MSNPYSRGLVWQLLLSGRGRGPDGASEAYSFHIELREGAAEAQVLLPLSYAGHFDDYGQVTYPAQAALLERVCQHEGALFTEQYPGVYAIPSDRVGPLTDALAGALESSRVFAADATISGTFEGRHAIVSLRRPRWGAPAQASVLRNAASAPLEALVTSTLQRLGAPGEPTFEPEHSSVLWAIPEPLTEPLRAALCAAIEPT